MTTRPFIPVVHGATEERPDEVDTLVAAEAVAAALERLGYRSEIVSLSLDLRPIQRLARKRPLIVFNLVEALETDMRAASLVPALLDRAKLAYTGSGFEAMVSSQSKLASKRVLACAGIATPAWSERGDDLPAGMTMMVKSVDEHASVGIDSRSVVCSQEAAAAIASREARFGGRFFAEAYIDGREFNISLIEGADGVEVLPMPEIAFVDFPDGRPKIVDYGAKWLEEDHAYHNTPRVFGVETREPELARRLKQCVLDTWRAFGISGYARVDLRVDGEGKPWVIDVNTNPCISPDAGLAAAAAEAGIGYDRLIERVVYAGLARAGATIELPRPRARRSRVSATAAASRAA
jgi:D-alanine-D-alanine ligase